MPFIIYTSNSLERLADSLAGIVQRPLDSPMRRETIVVMSPGMKRWLSLRLAGTLAVCANCDFLFPNVFIDRVFRNMVSEPSDDAFNREVMSWRIMGLLPQCVREPLFEELSLYLGDDSDLLRRWQLACKIAYVFDQYIMYRPAMIMDWERGGEGGWQAELWRRLSEGARMRILPPRSVLKQAKRIVCRTFTLCPSLCSAYPRCAGVYRCNAVAGLRTASFFSQSIPPLLGGYYLVSRAEPDYQKICERRRVSGRSAPRYRQ